MEEAVCTKKIISILRSRKMSRSALSSGSQSRRSLKIAEDLRRVLSELILEFCLIPSMRWSITVVRMSKDLLHASVYMDIGESDMGLLAKIGINRKVIEGIAKRLNLRRVPKLHFLLDDMLEKFRHFSEILGDG